MICARDNHTINPSEFATTVVPGMTFEMSIILRRRIAPMDNKRQCPQCKWDHSTVNTTHRWIKWHVALNLVYMLIIEIISCSCFCHGQFQIAEVVLNENDLRSDKMDKADHSKSPTMPASYEFTVEEGRPGKDQRIKFFRRVHQINFITCVNF
jgi:hypothetical protein